MRRIIVVALAAAFLSAAATKIPAADSAFREAQSTGCPIHYGVTKTRAYARWTFATHRRQRLRETHLARMIRCQHVPARTSALRGYRAELFALWRVECPGWDRVGDASVFTDRDYGIATRSYVKGGRWLLLAPNGTATVQVQTDWGPGIMHREFDLTPSAAEAHGYSAGGFPTDEGTWYGRFIGYRLPRGLHDGRVTLVCG